MHCPIFSHSDKNVKKIMPISIPIKKASCSQQMTHHYDHYIINMHYKF